MKLSDWLISIAALMWLLTIAWFDIRSRRVPSAWWTGIPLLVAGIYRLASGDSQLIVAAAAIALAVSERRHLQQKALEGLILVAGLAALIWIMFTTPSAVAFGVVGVLVFWISWERHYIGGADAMALITCLIVWPGVEFVMAYLIAGLVWSAAVRIKEGGWLKAHPSPGLAIVALAGIFYLAYRIYRSVKI